MPDLTPAQREALRVLYERDGWISVRHMPLRVALACMDLVCLGLAYRDTSMGTMGMFFITPAGRARHEKEEAT